MFAFTFILRSDRNFLRSVMLPTSKTWMWPLLSCAQAELRVLTFGEPPSWISDFRFHLTVLLMAPFRSMTPKMGVAAGILSLASLEAEIHLVGTLTASLLWGFHRPGPPAHTREHASERPTT